MAIASRSHVGASARLLLLRAVWRAGPAAGAPRRSDCAAKVQRFVRWSSRSCVQIAFSDRAGRAPAGVGGRRARPGSAVVVELDLPAPFAAVGGVPPLAQHARLTAGQEHGAADVAGA